MANVKTYKRTTVRTLVKHTETERHAHTYTETDKPTGIAEIILQICLKSETLCLQTYNHKEREIPRKGYHTMMRTERTMMQKMD